MQKVGDDNSVNRWLGYEPRLEEIQNIELLVLKIHIILEDALRHLLAMRLDVEENKVTDVRVGFEALTKLALAKSLPDPLCEPLLSLNRARNGAAHSIESQEFDGHVDRFMALVEALRQADGVVFKPAENRMARLRRAGNEAISEVFSRAAPFWDLS